VMGRHAGWIALHAGLAGGANVILIPEQPFSLERVCAYVDSRFQSHYAPIIVVAEGATPDGGENTTLDKGLDAFGHVRLGGIGEWLAGEIEKQTGKEARTTVLGHIQRGGTPSAFDRVLATRFGVHAIDAIHEHAFGNMVALRSTEIVRVPLTEATATLKTVPPEFYAEAEGRFQERHRRAHVGVDQNRRDCRGRCGAVRLHQPKNVFATSYHSSGTVFSSAVASESGTAMTASPRSAAICP